VIELGRAPTKAALYEGLERWKARHPEAAAHLEPADVLTDGMRGRAYVWYRLRVNLVHVPEALRPPQEPLDPDYDPWAGYEWPDRSGQPERAPRRADRPG
jgi:bifunctional non-homologous end joining protein LigD